MHTGMLEDAAAASFRRISVHGFILPIGSVLGTTYTVLNLHCFKFEIRKEILVFQDKNGETEQIYSPRVLFIYTLYIYQK